MRRLCICLVVLCVSVAVSAEIEPLQVPAGKMVEGIACHSNPTQTYTLYIPSAFAADRRYPVLLVFDPRGRSLLAAELFQEAAESYGWIIVSSDNTRSDGPWEPNLAAIQALWPEIHTRIPADFQRIYATGFSGGVAVATVLARTSGEIAGIIGCGGLNDVNQLDDAEVAFFSTAGNTDFNFSEMHRLDKYFAEQGNPHRLQIFDGPHTWMPTAVAREAVAWMELLAMQRGLRDRDDGLISSLYASDLARARELAAEGMILDAVRRLREMESTYKGLHATSEAGELGGRLARGDAYRLQLKKARRIRGFEDKCLERRNAELTRLRSSDVQLPTAQLAGNLHIRILTRDARDSGEEGLAAQRCLNSLYSALSFYLPQEDLPKQRYAQVAVSYELANMIRDDNPVVWYNLACVRALLGQKNDAMEALRKAVENGFGNTELLATDTDLDPLRKRDDFMALMASIPVP